jgi:hypothetical protein
MGNRIRVSRVSTWAWGIAALFAASGCAEFHHYQLSDIDSSEGRLVPFELQVDETGLDVNEAFGVAKLAVDENSKKRLTGVESAVAFFQVGPSTGDATFDDHWADNLVAALHERCSSGRMTGVTTVRESTDYPVVSGEIVTIKGYCVR